MTSGFVDKRYLDGVDDGDDDEMDEREEWLGDPGGLFGDEGENDDDEFFQGVEFSDDEAECVPATEFPESEAKGDDGPALPGEVPVPRGGPRV